MKKIVYKGLLEMKFNYEEDEVLGFTGEDFYLADIISWDIFYYGKYLSVRYFISNKALPIESLAEEFIKALHGAGDADYEILYTETTGYLWTSEKIKVGGHDLLDELSSAIGKYLYLEITYNKTNELA